MTGCNFGRRWIGQLEPVSHPRLSHDVAGVSGVLFDFLPELVYYNAQVFGFFGVVRAPNGLQKPFMCKRLSLLHNQDAQNLKLLGAKVYPLAPNVDDPFFQIDTQFRSFHLRQWFVDRGTSKRCPDSSKELAYGKRLYNVIVRARILSCSALRTVTMMIGPSKDSRILLQASKPLMPGIFTSKRIRAGCS